MDCLTQTSWCSLRDRAARRTLVEGYTRQKFRVIPSDLSSFLLNLFDAVAYWTFDSLSTDFYDLAYRHVLFGPRIAFKNIVFQCTMCPSGWSHRDCVQFYIEFDKEQMRGRLPLNVQSVTAYLVIYCHQIQYEYRTPKVFHNIDSAQGWPAYRIAICASKTGSRSTLDAISSCSASTFVMGLSRDLTLSQMTRR